MRQNDAPRAGLLSNGAAVDSREDVRSAAYPAETDCRECSGRTGAGYILCRDCLESLPDELCTSQVLGALVR